jgi:hypothetical protein
MSHPFLTISPKEKSKFLYMSSSQFDSKEYESDPKMKDKHVVLLESHQVGTGMLITHVS